MSLQVQNLSFHYPDGQQVLKSIDFVIEQGEQVALMGHNGAGKTTLIKQLNGLIRPTSGCVIINDRDTVACPPEELSTTVGMVFQNPDHQLFAATVEREVAFGPANMGASPDQVRQRTLEAMHLTEISKFADQNPYDLSPSERKRVAFASVLSISPLIYLLDEPIQGQDHFGRETIKQVIEHLKRCGKTVIAIIHDVDFAAEVFDRAIILKEGQIAADGPMSDIAAEMGSSCLSLPKPQVTEMGCRLGVKKVILNPRMLVEHLGQCVRDQSEIICLQTSPPDPLSMNGEGENG